MSEPGLVQGELKSDAAAAVPSAAETPGALTSSGMAWLVRSIRKLRLATQVAGEEDASQWYEFHPAANLWLQRRANHFHCQPLQKWEYETPLHKDRAFETLQRETKQATRVRVASEHDSRTRKEERRRSIPFIPPVKGTSVEDTLALQDVLDTPQLREVFRTFLEENYCSENLDFLEAVEKYQSSGRKAMTAWQIYSEFIQQNAPRQVNIDSYTRNEVEQRMREHSLDSPAPHVPPNTPLGLMPGGATDPASLDRSVSPTAITALPLSPTEGIGVASSAVSPRATIGKPSALQRALSYGLATTVQTAVVSGSGPAPLTRSGSSSVITPPKDTAKTVFDQAVALVKRMIEDDVYQRFVATDEYADMQVAYLQDQLVSGKKFKGRGWENKQYQSLIIDVLEAADVTAKKAAVYCAITLDAKCYKTAVTKKTQAPEWNEHFELPLSTTSQYVEINMYEEGGIGSDAFLGGVFLPIERIKNKEEPVWYRALARARNQKVSGALRLKITFSENPAKDDVHQAIVEEKGLSLTDVFRSKVSRNKKRFQEDGFDLDLSYITDRVIAMAYPAENITGMYRNRMKDVQRFFDKKHPSCYKVYNLCSEMSYEPSKFGWHVARYPFDDHNPCPFYMIPEFVRDMADWLSEHPQNVAAVHCKAGKGRSGLMVAAFLLWSQHPRCWDADDALRFFAEQRTEDAQGITIPSQRRYVSYADQYFKSEQHLLAAQAAGQPLTGRKPSSLFNQLDPSDPFTVITAPILDSSSSSSSTSSASASTFTPAHSGGNAMVSSLSLTSFLAQPSNMDLRAAAAASTAPQDGSGGSALPPSVSVVSSLGLSRSSSLSSDNSSQQSDGTDVAIAPLDSLRPAAAAMMAPLHGGSAQAATAAAGSATGGEGAMPTTRLPPGERFVFLPQHVVKPQQICFLETVSLFNVGKALTAATVKVWFVVTQSDSYFSSRGHIVARINDDDSIEFRCGAHIPINDDVKVEFFHNKGFGGRTKMCQLWFNTRFVNPTSTLSFPKTELDGACKDVKHKAFSSEFKIELGLQSTPTLHDTLVRSRERARRMVKQRAGEVATGSSGGAAAGSRSRPQLHIIPSQREDSEPSGPRPTATRFHELSSTATPTDSPTPSSPPDSPAADV